MLLPLLLLALMALFFVWGFMVARGLGRPAMLWGVICALTLFIGIAILYGMGDRHGRAHRPQVDDHGQDMALLAASETSETNLLAQPAAAVAPSTGESPEDRRWRYLCDYRPELQNAIAEIEPLGEDALNELKAAYLVLNDASLLPAIVQRLHDRFGSPAGSSRRALTMRPPMDLRAQTTMRDAPPVQETIQAPARPLGASGLAPPRDLTAARDAVTTTPAGSNGHDHDADEPIMLRGPMPAGSGQSLRAGGIFAQGQGSLATRPAQAHGLTSNGAARQRLASFDVAAFDRDIELAGPPAVATELQREVFVSAPSDLRGLADPPVDVFAEERQNGGGSGSSDLLDDGVGIQTDDDMPVQAAGHTFAVPPRVSERTTVLPADLQGAQYLETYSGVHLFALADGRVFIDRHEARPSLQMAKAYVDQVTDGRGRA